MAKYTVDIRSGADLDVLTIEAYSPTEAAFKAGVQAGVETLWQAAGDIEAQYLFHQSRQRCVALVLRFVSEELSGVLVRETRYADEA